MTTIWTENECLDINWWLVGLKNHINEIAEILSNTEKKTERIPMHFLF